MAMLVAVAALATSSVTSAAPGNVTPPSVAASSYRVGATLYADPGTWSGNPTSYSFQWKKCKLDPSYTCQSIAGATGATHVVTADDGVWIESGFLPERSFMFGIRIIVAVTASDGSTSATAQSQLDATLPSVVSAPVAGSTQTFGAPPAGVPEIDGAIDPVPTCNINSGPICINPLGPYYKIGGRYSLPEGGTLTSFSAYFQGGENSQQFTPLIYRVDASGLPTRLVVRGNPFTVPVGAPAGWFTSSFVSPLQVSAGTYVLTFLAGDTTYPGAGPYFYIPAQSIGFSNVNTNLEEGTPGFSEPTFVPSDPFGTVEHFAGELPKAYVTYTPTSASTAGNTALPGLGGTAQQGQAMTVSTGSWSNNPTGFTYQWQRCDSGGSACVDLAGQVASAYALVAADVGQTLRARVRAINEGGISAFASSAASPVVVAAGSGSVAPINNALPVITGAPQSTSTLTSTTGTWLNNPTSYAFQWQRCNSSGGSCVDIGGATSSTFALGAIDLGSTIRSVVTATNGTGFAVAASLATAVVTVPGSGGGGGGGGGGSTSVPDLRVSITSNAIAYAPGTEADFVVTVANVGGAGSLQTHLVIAIPAGLTLLGAPAPDRGSGCPGSPTVDCFLDYIPNGGTARVIFAVRVGSTGPQSVTVTASSDREANPADNGATATLQVTTPPAPPKPPAVARPVFGLVTGTHAGPSSGKRFAFKLPVRRSDTRALLTSGRLVVTTTLGGKPIARTSSLKAGEVQLSLLVPKHSTGKLLKITVTVTSGSQSATKSFTYRVR